MLACKIKCEIFHSSNSKGLPTLPGPPSHLPVAMGSDKKPVRQCALPPVFPPPPWLPLLLTLSPPRLLGDTACKTFSLLLLVAREWALMLRENNSSNPHLAVSEHKRLSLVTEWK